MNESSIKEIDRFRLTLSDWQDRTFGQATLESVLAHMREEIDEVIENPDDLYEWADMLLLFLGAMSKQGIRFEEVFDKSRDKFYNVLVHRQWGNPDSNGVVRHIKEEV